jgi:prevent-host-death family protein
MIGMRDLRQRAAEVLRRIREEKTKFIITYRGKPVALLSPLDAKDADEEITEIDKPGTAEGWETYTQAADAVRNRWPTSLKTETVLDEIRR